MTLRTKTTLIVSTSFLALIGLLCAAALVIVLGRFRQLEDEEARRNAERARDALNDQVANLAATASDWAHWDDAAAFVQGHSPQFMRVNLSDNTFLTLRLDVMVFLGPDGEVVYERWFDRGARVAGKPPEGFARVIAPGAPLVAHPDIESRREGLLVLPGVILLIASHPVTDSARSPPKRGVLVFARIMDDVEMQRLSGIVQLRTRLLPLADRVIEARERTLLGKSAIRQPALVRVKGRNLIASMVRLPDVTGDNSVVLRVDAPRPFFQQGLQSIHYLAGSLVACCLLTAALLWVLLSRSVLSPLSALAANVRRIGATGGTARVAVQGQDELAQVSRSINDMLDALSRSEEERTHLEERLAHAHRLEAIGTLAGGVAHDFNNILTAIIGFCDLLDEPHAPVPNGSAEVAEIRKAAEKAASLTAQLLAFSRKQRLRFQVIDFNELLSEMGGMLRRLLGGHLTLELALEAKPAAISADRSQLQQVILNLAVNARDAMPEGGTLTLATKNARVGAESRTDGLELKPGEYVQCTVSDSGSGMDESVRARIFEPFFTTKELGRGTGLGLSVVWGIIKQCDGAITVASVPGKGTSFDIYLPASPDSIARASSSPRPAPAARGGATVLLAEDDKAVRRFLVAVLSRAGYRIVEAADGEEALRRAEEIGGDRIQLLLSDIVMPGMSGAILAQRLRERYPSLKVLFISGNADLMASGAALPNDARILQKPFDRRLLISTVRATLEG